ncbi:MAG TPA: hypothetical protein VGQ24_09115 [Gemmatimonadales bacterium]|nr:hypothetical protein [Gemmatimonadales bacterium]
MFVPAPCPSGSVLPSDEPQAAHAVTELVKVLFEPVLHLAGTVPCQTQVRVDPLHHLVRLVA